jgi:hypothetical protein
MMTPKEIARRIVDDLFVYGATRIALMRQVCPGGPEKNLGGWCKQAARDQVEDTVKMLVREWGA